MAARLRAFAALALGLPLLLVVLNAALMPEPPAKGTPRPAGYMAKFPDQAVVSAHRGSRYLNPENTLLAHRMADAMGAHVLEMDVRLTRDGHLVVFHDPDNARVVGGPGPAASVEQSTLEEVRAWDVGATYSPDGGATRPMRGKGVRVPTFHEFMVAFSDRNINVEIKEDDTRVADAVLAEFAAWPGVEDRVVVGGRYCGVVQHFRRLVGDRFATSACETEGIRHVLLATAGLAVPFYRLVSPPPFRALQIPTVSGAFPLATRANVELAHAFGVEVHFWVVNDAETVRHCLDIGADAVVTDRADMAVPLLESRGHPAGAGRAQAGGVPDHFVPPESPPEIHGCVTAACHAMQMVNPFTLWALYSALVAAALWLPPLCCRRGKAKSA